MPEYRFSIQFFSCKYVASHRLPWRIVPEKESKSVGRFSKKSLPEKPVSGKRDITTGEKPFIHTVPFTTCTEEGLSKHSSASRNSAYITRIQPTNSIGDTS